MRLLVSTPNSIIVDDDNVSYVRAEDASGAFGILAGHTNFITILEISVISWRDDQGHEQHLAVRSGVLTVRDGNLVEVATRQAVTETKLQRLGESILETFRREQNAEESARTSTTRLQLATIRQLQRYFASQRQPITPGATTLVSTQTVTGLSAEPGLT